MTLEAVAPPEAVEELLRQLVDARFVLTDRSGCITRWSRPAEHVFGWPASAMVGRGLLETLAIPGSIPPAGGHLEAAARRKDGSEVQVDLTLVPVQMAHSLEFNGFLEALEIVGPARGRPRAAAGEPPHRRRVDRRGHRRARRVPGGPAGGHDRRLQGHRRVDPRPRPRPRRRRATRMPPRPAPAPRRWPRSASAPPPSWPGRAPRRRPPPTASRSWRARVGASTPSWPTPAPRSSRCRPTWRRCAAS